MGGDEDAHMGFQDNSELMLSCCPSSEMDTSSQKIVSGLAMNSRFGSSNRGKESCYGSGWEPITPLNQNENLGPFFKVSNADLAIHSYPFVSESKGLSSTSQFMHYSSDTSAADMLARFPAFGGGNFSGTANFYYLSECAHNSGVFGPSMGSVQTQEDTQTSPNGKRKRRDSSGEISEMKELDEKKQKIEESGSSDQSNKQTGRHAKDNCSGEEDSKGYVHVRAKRGQATNTHSLAERVRRGKINDRMRLLQDLVPGCSKITGKAVMLDEIINYVQSLQQQVEFLSMKLANVNPVPNFNIEQILSKENLHSSGILGFNLGMSSSQAGTPGIHQEQIPLPVVPNSTSLYHPIPQGLWDGNLQTLHHMSYDPNSPVGNLGSNGR